MKFYFDENITPQIAKALAILQEPRPVNVEYLLSKTLLGQGTPDEEWIPKVAEEDGVVITQDFNIQRTRHQRELYRQYGLGVVFLKPPKKSRFGYWDIVNKL
ncbi:MAG: hypothetical protein U5K72_02920 [Balneolaceae bacterium]|nr:hypothetical protein [Balneolaceae bacterium]